MTVGTIPARAETSQSKSSPPEYRPPHWAAVAGFGPYLEALRSGNVSARRPSFVGAGLEIWQMKYIKAAGRKAVRS